VGAGTGIFRFLREIRKIVPLKVHPKHHRRAAGRQILADGGKLEKRTI
jgi:hypothetical protein